VSSGSTLAIDTAHYGIEYKLLAVSIICATAQNLMLWCGARL